MKRFLRSNFAVLGLVLGSLGAAQAAHAADVYFSVGVPVSPEPIYVAPSAPVYVAPPAPVYAPQPVYVEPAPVYVPRYGYASDWERERAWREGRWHHGHEWHEHQRGHEWHRGHDDD